MKTYMVEEPSHVKHLALNECKIGLKKEGKKEKRGGTKQSFRDTPQLSKSSLHIMSWTGQIFSTEISLKELARLIINKK